MLPRAAGLASPGSSVPTARAAGACPREGARWPWEGVRPVRVQTDSAFHALTACALLHSGHRGDDRIWLLAGLVTRLTPSLQSRDSLRQTALAPLCSEASCALPAFDVAFSGRILGAVCHGGPIPACACRWHGGRSACAGRARSEDAAGTAGRCASTHVKRSHCGDSRVCHAHGALPSRVSGTCAELVCRPVVQAGPRRALWALPLLCRGRLRDAA